MKRSYGRILCLTAILCAVSAQAETPAPAQDFTFKRLKVPQRGAPPKITVQIDPVEQARVQEAAVAKARAINERLEGLKKELAEKVEEEDIEEEGNQELEQLLARSAPFDWYWSEVSPSMNDSGPGRLAQALLHLRKAPPEAANLSPRLQTLQDITLKHGTEIMVATIGTRVSPALALALISVESAGKTDATSSAGARGLMQLMPATAERFGVTDSTDATQNIKGGVAYLDWLMEKFDGDPILVLAGYNAGENAVISNGGVPPYAETRGYVPKVLAAWEVARGMCLTPPQLVSDGCVFANKNEVTGG
ncbi:lytic transglycosylase domain-containing protein [Falsihalocynthiibacter sp. SS001]|uniref:lytic transglycosylase domain-containing protein n=1 Tax=Falsihalocynthiibacter sp. SS001 TaxID=3349698 RepID=UPI0036D28539